MEMMAGYGGAFKEVQARAGVISISGFMWGEGELVGLVVKLWKEDKGESRAKKCCVGAGWGRELGRL